MQVIPHEQLSPEALRGILLEFVTREGGNNHDQDTVTVDHMIDQVQRQLDTGRVVVVYDTELHSCSIVRSEDLEFDR